MDSSQNDSMTATVPTIHPAVSSPVSENSSSNSVPRSSNNIPHPEANRDGILYEYDDNIWIFLILRIQATICQISQVNTQYYIAKIVKWIIPKMQNHLPTR